MDLLLNDSLTSERFSNSFEVLLSLKSVFFMAVTSCNYFEHDFQNEKMPDGFQKSLKRANREGVSPLLQRRRLSAASAVLVDNRAGDEVSLHIGTNQVSQQNLSNDLGDDYFDEGPLGQILPE
jgi:hypothetical protein